MSNQKEKPYIGVTGLDQPREARAVVQSFTNMGLTDDDNRHQGMIGLLVSERRLLLPDRNRPRHPSLPTIRQILETTGGKVFNTLHYNTQHPNRLSDQMKKLLGDTGFYNDRLCHGVQLNMRWPDVDEIKRTKDSFPDLKVILQLGPNALTFNPQRIAEALSPYIGHIDYALIDPSAGRNVIPHVNTVAPVYNEISDAYPNLSLTFAGGYNARNARSRLWLLFQMVGTSNFGIDAESGLRSESHQANTDTSFNINMARRYIRNSATFFNRQSY